MHSQSRRRFLQQSLSVVSTTLLATYTGQSLAKPHSEERPVVSVDPRRGSFSCDNAQVPISDKASRLSRVEDFRQEACQMTRDSFEGPYYFCTNPAAKAIAQGKAGQPLVVALRALDALCEPIAGATIDIWHCDAQGVYSGYAVDANAPRSHVEPINDEYFCRGALKTDEDGIAEFLTIYPGFYIGRAVHIHFKAHVGNQSYVTNQAYLPESWNARLLGQAPYNARGVRRVLATEEGWGISEMRVLERDGAGVLLAVLDVGVGE